MKTRNAREGRYCGRLAAAYGEGRGHVRSRTARQVGAGAAARAAVARFVSRAEEHYHMVLVARITEQDAAMPGEPPDADPLVPCTPPSRRRAAHGFNKGHGERHLAEADKHIENAKDLIHLQRRLIERMQARGRPTEEPEKRLVTMLVSLALMRRYRDLVLDGLARNGGDDRKG